jgi:hypothetical protein
MLVICSGTAWGQGGPPLLTDDPGTPGPHHWEINIAATMERSRTRRLFELPLVDINYGVGERIQLKFEAPWLLLREKGQPAAKGIGNSLVGVKWRFFEDENRGLAVSTYPQLEFKGSAGADDDEFVEGRPQLILPVEVTKGFGSISINGEMGYRVVPRGTDELFYGLAIGRQLTRRAQLLGEINGESLRNFRESELLFNLGMRLRVNRKLTLLFSAGRPLRKVSADDPNFIAYAGTQFTF